LSALRDRPCSRTCSPNHTLAGAPATTRDPDHGGATEPKLGSGHCFISETFNVKKAATVSGPSRGQRADRHRHPRDQPPQHASSPHDHRRPTLRPTTHRPGGLFTRSASVVVSTVCGTRWGSRKSRPRQYEGLRPPHEAHVGGETVLGHASRGVVSLPQPREGSRASDIPLGPTSSVPTR